MRSCFPNVGNRWGLSPNTRPAIVQEVREWAEANGTSLNQYVRDCLAAKAAELEQQRSVRADRFLAFARANLAHAPKGWHFDRQRDGVRNLEAFG